MPVLGAPEGDSKKRARHPALAAQVANARLLARSEARALEVGLRLVFQAFRAACDRGDRGWGLVLREDRDRAGSGIGIQVEGVGQDAGGFSPG
jgi:hypothetical protein